ncbi:MAG: PilZ domain-containing protein [Aliidongia sp.]
MTGIPSIERRRHARFDGSEYPLRIARCSARLLNWSASGVGLQVKEGIGSFTLGEPVELGILNERIFAVLMFTGRIQRIDAANHVVGVEFLSGAETIIPLLVETLGQSADKEIL